jgi:soluble lytic murein transglycosylase-like protein
VAWCWPLLLLLSCSVSKLPAIAAEQPTTPREESVKVPGIPELAYALKRNLIGEIRFWWGFDTRTTVFFSQVHQESRWDPEAKSKYASGLAQFTPSTAEWISKLYPKDLGDNNPLDSKWALRALVRYDKLLFDGATYAASNTDRWSFALSGYNGGAGWVKKDRALTTNAGRDPNRWACNVEHHSSRADWAIKENRDYIVKILSKWFSLYEKGGF